MFRRKLEALEYPLTSTFDAQDEKKFRDLVQWLEDQKIRLYEMEGREGLRNTGSDRWSAAFQKYLQDLELDYLKDFSRLEIIDQLLGVALMHEYYDGKQKFSEASSDKIAQKTTAAPKILASNPFDNLDFSSPEFVSGVNELANYLQVAQHADHLVTLEACARLIKSRYSKTAIANGEHLEKKGEAFPFLEADMGVDSSDPVFCSAAKILRLLFIADIRDLQTKINECIVSIQTISANPKTDTRLGKVGY